MNHCEKCCTRLDACEQCMSEKIAALENEIRKLNRERDKLISVFKTCRDATGYSDDGSRGAYNGIEWCISCMESSEPNYKSKNREPPTCVLGGDIEALEQREDV